MSKGKGEVKQRPLPTTMEDNVLVKCFRVRNHGEIQAAKLHFKLVPLQKLCDSQYKLQVKDNNICAFSKRRFHALRKALLKDLSTEHNDEG